MVGEEIYKAMIKVDGECFAYFAYDSPEKIVSPEVLKIIRKSYAKVLRTIEEHCTIAFLSTESMNFHAKWVHGTVQTLQTEYKARPEKFISAETGNKLVPGCHPCSLYNKKFAANMETKSTKMDKFGTNMKRSCPGHKNADPCTHCMDCLDTSSPEYRAMQERARRGAELGRRTARQRDRDAYDAVENGTASPGGDEEVRVLTRQLAAENLHENGHAANGGRTTKRKFREAKVAMNDGSASQAQKKRAKNFDEGHTSKRGKSCKNKKGNLPTNILKESNRSKPYVSD